MEKLCIQKKYQNLWGYIGPELLSSEKENCLVINLAEHASRGH